jgi:hypothetical protein
VEDEQGEMEAERAAFSFRSTSYTFGKEVSNERTGIICHASISHEQSRMTGTPTWPKLTQDSSPA